MGRMRWLGVRRGRVLGSAWAVLACCAAAGCGASNPLALAVPQGLRTVEPMKLPLADSFLALSTLPGGEVLEQFSLRNGAPLRTLLDLPKDRFLAPGVAAGSGGAVWLTLASGARERGPWSLGWAVSGCSRQLGVR